MKINTDDHERLQVAVTQVIDSGMIEDLAWYQSHGLTPRRWRWDIFHKTCDLGLVNPSQLYSYLNDDQIDTAMRKITNTEE